MVVDSTRHVHDSQRQAALLELELTEAVAMKNPAQATQAIIQMAHSLELITIAEGVETETQLDFLKTHGCDEVQGYHYSRPLEAQDFEAFLTSHG